MIGWVSSYSVELAEGGPRRGHFVWAGAPVARDLFLDARALDTLLPHLFERVLAVLDDLGQGLPVQVLDGYVREGMAPGVVEVVVVGWAGRDEPTQPPLVPPLYVPSEYFEPHAGEAAPVEVDNAWCWRDECGERVDPADMLGLCPEHKAAMVEAIRP